LSAARRLLVGAVALPIAVGAGLWTAPRWLVPAIAARSPGCLYAVPTRERLVALTLDDGPDAAHTPGVLALLRAHRARATFFLISERARRQAPLVRAIVVDGHEIGNHLTRDEPSARLAPAAFEAALREAGSVLGRFAPVRWFRPGSGWYTSAMLAAAARAGYRCALGSVYPYDPHVPSSRFAAAYILANVRPGAVLVLHEGGGRGRRTVETLRRVLPALHARGYRVVGLTELTARQPRSRARASVAPAAGHGAAAVGSAGCRAGAARAFHPARTPRDPSPPQSVVRGRC
jgi:peptidoglycan/xylan/chitin deacetylase (PgdA/CDA1 family)